MGRVDIEGGAKIIRGRGIVTEIGIRTGVIAGGRGATIGSRMNGMRGRRRAERGVARGERREVVRIVMCLWLCLVWCRLGLRGDGILLSRRGDDGARCGVAGGMVRLRA